jgi:hypothetical protein
MASNVKLDDHVFRELTAKIGKAKNAFVKVGVLQAQGSTAANDGEITLAELAAIHEFGAPRANIPARSFLRATLTQDPGREGVVKMVTGLAKGIIAEKLEVKEALDRLGAWAAAQVKKRIKAHIPPPLKPETIKRKLSKHGAGGSTPLVATSQLINAIMWEVKQ